MSERDPGEDAAEALFEAARKEQPDGRVRARTKVLTRNALRGIQAANTREQARAEAPQYVALAGAALVVAAAVLALVISKQRPEHERPPITVKQEEVAREKPLEQAPAARELVENARTVEAAPPKQQPASKRERRAAPTLAEEIALLDQARDALSKRDGVRVLALVHQYERELVGTRMRAEAELLRIEALAQSGRQSEATKLAARFIEQYAGNPLTDRARALATPENPLEERP